MKQNHGAFQLPSYLKPNQLPIQKKYKGKKNKLAKSRYQPMQMNRLQKRTNSQATNI